MRPNFLAHWSLSTQHLSPWSLAPEQSPPDLSLTLTARSPITWFQTPTRSLFFSVKVSPWSLDRSHQPCFGQTPPQSRATYHPPNPWYSIFKHLTPCLTALHNSLLANTYPVPDLLLLFRMFCFINKTRFSKISLALDRPLVNSLSLPPTQSLILCFHKYHYLIACYPRSLAKKHPPSPRSSAFVPGLMHQKQNQIFENFPCFWYTPGQSYLPTTHSVPYILLLNISLPNRLLPTIAC